MDQQTISKTGNKAFSLIEVLLAVAILTVGLIAIIRGYVVALSALKATEDYIQEVSLAKDKMADLKEQAMAAKGYLQGAMQGQFPSPDDGFFWQAQISPSGQKGLNEIDLTVSDAVSSPARTFSLVAYVDVKE